MKFRRIAAATMVAGMLAVTGCSANTPERNHGNRNGERLTEAVNRNNGRTHRGLFGRTTRGINRAARNIDNTARSGMTDGVNSRYTRTPSRSTMFRPQNRIGNTFRYGTDHRVPATTLENHTNRYEMNRINRGTTNTNRATRRAHRFNNTNGIGVVNNTTTPVFFNKSKAAPEQQPETTPAPVTPAPASPQAR